MAITSKFGNLDTDNTLGGNNASDQTVASQKAIKTYVDNRDATKQDILVSGTNIKTINDISILGSGNIEIQSGGMPSLDEVTITTNSDDELQAIAVKNQNTSSLTYYAWEFGTFLEGIYYTTSLEEDIQLDLFKNENGSFVKVTEFRSSELVDCSIYEGQLYIENAEEYGDSGVRVSSEDISSSPAPVKTWTGTKAEYDAIATKDSNTLYNITDDSDVTLTLLNVLFPVGAYYLGDMATCPLAELGIGTWQALPPDTVIQIAGTRGSVGTTLNESLPNITGEFTVDSGAGFQDGSAKSGAFKMSSTSTGWRGATTNTSGYYMAFDASLSSSTYQDNAPVQPKARLTNGWRRIA